MTHTYAKAEVRSDEILRPVRMRPAPVVPLGFKPTAGPAPRQIGAAA